MIRRCQGPGGQPGLKAVNDADGRETECFWWEPGVVGSSARAHLALADAAREIGAMPAREADLEANIARASVPPAPL